MLQVQPAPVNGLIHEALILRDLGLSVFPVGEDKRPVVKWGQLATKLPTESQIRQQFTKRSAAGIACACGKVSGAVTSCHVVRDFDHLSEYEKWAGSNPALASECPTVETRRGRHVHLKVPHPVKWQKLQNGELISDDHYVILPPSRITKSGSDPHIYRWVGVPPFSPSHFPVRSLEETGFLDGSYVSEAGEGNSNTTYGYSDRRENGLEGAEEPNTTYVNSNGSELTPEIREAALRTQPTEVGTRNIQIGRFARALFDTVPWNAPSQFLYEAFRVWFRLATPVIRTKDFDTSFRDFRTFWAKTHTAMNCSRPMRKMREAADIGANRTERLLNACRALAMESPDGTFFLSSRAAGGVLGVCHATAQKEIGVLVKAGRIRVVEKAFPSATKRIATKYRIGQ